MKKIKMKDTILSHYQKVHELAMDGITVRVWKPRTMPQLPAYMMKAWIKYQAHTKRDYLAVAAKAEWRMGNPDYGLWDAQTVYHVDPRRRMLDIYIAALLVRPFSEQAFNYYVNQYDNIDDVNQRLMLMWDSREFDRANGIRSAEYMTAIELAKYEKYIYQVRHPERDAEEQEDIEDMSNLYCGGAYVEEPEENHRCVKFRVKDDNIVYNALMGKDETMKRGGTELMHACAKVFCDFRKEHPEVTEMHFYTDELLDVKQ